MQKTITTILALVSLGAGFFLYQYMQKPKPVTTTAKPAVKKSVSVLNQQRIDFSLPDMQGQQRKFSEWDGKVVLLNFWATWCPPCRKEIPAFIELQRDYGGKGFQVIGVAIDEMDAITDFTDGLGLNYPILIGNTAALKISNQYGNRFGQLPYSLIIDKQGIIRYIGKGELSYEAIEKEIQPLLK